jgi:Uncharacterized protein conserved in bacteria (DUF2255)
LAGHAEESTVAMSEISSRSAIAIRPGGLDKDVTFAYAYQAITGEIDTAYRNKYGSYVAHTMDAITSPAARSSQGAGPVVGRQSRSASCGDSV